MEDRHARTIDDDRLWSEIRCLRSEGGGRETKNLKVKGSALEKMDNPLYRPSSERSGLPSSIGFINPRPSTSGLKRLRANKFNNCSHLDRL